MKKIQVSISEKMYDELADKAASDRVSLSSVAANLIYQGLVTDNEIPRRLEVKKADIVKHEKTEKFDRLLALQALHYLQIITSKLLGEEADEIITYVKKSSKTVLDNPEFYEAGNG
jgi:hypothetical protein